MESWGLNTSTPVYRIPLYPLWESVAFKTTPKVQSHLPSSCFYRWCQHRWSGNSTVVPWSDNKWRIPLTQKYFYLVVEPTPLKNIRQIGSFPQIRVKIKNLWNHQVGIFCNVNRLSQSTSSLLSIGTGSILVENSLRLWIRPWEVCAREKFWLILTPTQQKSATWHVNFPTTLQQDVKTVYPFGL